MIFQSLTYVTFLVLVLAGYWTLRHRWQNWFLRPCQPGVLRLEGTLVSSAVRRDHDH